MRIKTGEYYTFTPTSKTDVTGRDLLPGRVRAVRKLTRKECIEGEMWEVVHHASGHTFDAFHDELT